VPQSAAPLPKKSKAMPHVKHVQELALAHRAHTNPKTSQQSKEIHSRIYFAAK